MIARVCGVPSGGGFAMPLVGRILNRCIFVLSVGVIPLTSREQTMLLMVAAGRLRPGYCRLVVKIHSAAAVRKMEANTFSDLAKMAETWTIPKLRSAPRSAR